MEPVMERLEPFSVLGIQTRITRGSETQKLYAGIWEKFESRGREIEAISTGNHYFGVSFPTDSEDVNEYLAGMMVAVDCPVPEGLQKRTIAGGHFAIFECPVEGIGACYRHIFTTWLPGAPVPFDPTAPVFEEYPEGSSQRPVRIHIPVGGRERG